MGKIILIFLFIVNAIYSLWNPWFGVSLGYLFNILAPQYIWWWHFQGLRPFQLIAIPVLIGFIIAIFRGMVDFSILKNFRFYSVVILFLSLFISFFFGTYVNVINEWAFFKPNLVAVALLKILTFYVIALCCIDNKIKLKIFSLILPISVFYLTYWANLRYLSGHIFVRLHGPSAWGAGYYTDENCFAMIFVLGIPFFFFLGWYLKKWYFRLPVWLIIPFAWHAVFLTASRGGLLGAAVVSVLAGLRSPKKLLGIMLIPAFIIAYIWQGGSTLKERAQTITEYEQESSARTRLEAWQAGFRMVLAHPITGVGLASFGQAFPDFSDKKPRVAHNSFIQVMAESGVIAGLAYVAFLISCLFTAFKSRDFFEPESFFYYLSDAVLISLFGFIVCSLFLSLNTLEVQFYLAILANSIAWIAKENKEYA